MSHSGPREGVSSRSGSGSGGPDPAYRSVSDFQSGLRASLHRYGVFARRAWELYGRAMETTRSASAPQHSPRIGERTLFPRLTAQAYLAHCAISPPSTHVIEHVNANLEDSARIGVAAHGEWMRRRDELKNDLGKLIGAPGSDIALLPNTTSGVVTAALCIDWRPGDRIVVLRGEFPTNVMPWLEAARRHDLRVSWLDVADFRGDAATGLQKLESILAKGARLVAVSMVQFQTGLAMPVAEIGAICRAHGTELFVDAIQGIGIVPFDAQAVGANYVAGGGHKWLMGPKGTGYLYVAAPAMQRFNLRVAGWLSYEEPVEFLFGGTGLLRYDKRLRHDADALETGMINAPGFAGLHAAVEDLLSLGVDAVFAHVQRYHDRIEAGLTRIGFTTHRDALPQRRSGILAVKPPNPLHARDLPGRLAGSGIVVTAPDGWLRVAPHWPNSLDETDLVIEEMARCLQPDT